MYRNVNKKRYYDKKMKRFKISNYLNCYYCGRVYYIEDGYYGMCSKWHYDAYWRAQNKIESYNHKTAL
jgi:hypothetical protein